MVVVVVVYHCEMRGVVEGGQENEQISPVDSGVFFLVRCFGGSVVVYLFGGSLGRPGVGCRRDGRVLRFLSCFVMMMSDIDDYRPIAG